MPVGSMSVNGRLDGGVEQLDHQDQNHCANEQAHFDPVRAQKEGARQQHNKDPGLLLKSGFIPTGLQSRKRKPKGMVDATKTTSFLLWIDGVCFLHPLNFHPDL